MNPLDRWPIIPILKITMLKLVILMISILLETIFLFLNGASTNFQLKKEIMKTNKIKTNEVNALGSSSILYFMNANNG